MKFLVSNKRWTKRHGLIEATCVFEGGCRQFVPYPKDKLYGQVRRREDVSQFGKRLPQWQLETERQCLSEPSSSK